MKLFCDVVPNEDEERLWNKALAESPCRSSAVTVILYESHSAQCPGDIAAGIFCSGAQ